MIVEAKSLDDIRAIPYSKMQLLEVVNTYGVFQYGVQSLGV
jgi:hypothetical protein